MFHNLDLGPIETQGSEDVDVSQGYTQVILRQSVELSGVLMKLPSREPPGGRIRIPVS